MSSQEHPHKIWRRGGIKGAKRGAANCVGRGYLSFSVRAGQTGEVTLGDHSIFHFFSSRAQRRSSCAGIEHLFSSVFS